MKRSVLSDPTYRSLWIIGGLNGIARWLEMLVAAIFVFDETGSPLLVAMLMVLRFAPMALFGMAAGDLAERFAPQRILIVGMGIMSLSATVVITLAALGLLQVWHIFAATVVSGVVSVADFPVRRTLVHDVVGSDRVGEAMTLDTLAGAGTKMIGPMAGGALFASLGLAGAWTVAMAAYLVSVLALARLTVPRHAAAAPPEADRVSLREALASLSRDRFMPGLLLTTVAFNLWAFPFMSMIPVIGKDVLGLDPTGVGLLTSTDGLGSLIGAALMIALSSRRNYRRLYSGGLFIYLICAVLFATSTWVSVSAMVLIVSGMATTAFVAMQSALVLLNSPDHLRRRYMAMLTVCIGTGPVGFLHMGALAEWLGPQTACVVVALEGLVVMTGLVVFFPTVLAAQSTTGESQIARAQDAHHESSTDR